MFRPRFGRLFALVMAAGIALLVVHLAVGFGGEGVNPLFDHWLYNVLRIAAALACLTRAARIREERWAWGLIGAGLLLNALGDTYWTAFIVDDPSPPVPSVGDVLMLSMYPLLFAGVALLLHRRYRGLSAGRWLDGAIGGLAVTGVGTQVLLTTVLDHTSGSLGEFATAIAFPIGDLALLAFAGAILVSTAGRPGRSLWLLAGGLLAISVVDVFYAYASTAGTYAEGSVFDALWPLGFALIAWAAWTPADDDLDESTHLHRPLAAAALFMALFAGTRIYGRFEDLEFAADTLVTAAGIAFVARLLVAVVENQRLLARAETDALTGLSNRGKLQIDLDRACVDRRSRVLVLFDLNGFKAYNDSLGHPAGDELLIRLSERLADAAPEGGSVYRMGGDEFAAVFPGRLSEADAEIRALTDALSEDVNEHMVTASWGAAEIPTEALDTSTALRTADKRLYADKDRRRMPQGGRRAADARVPVTG